MIVFFTTVVRGAPLAAGGELVKVDWDSKEVLGRVPIVPSNPDVDDPNPRGSTRGGRGIVLRDRKLLVANYHSLLTFDQALSHLGSISNRLFVGLHELAQTEDRIWVAATSIDAALAVDDGGILRESWWPRETSALRARLSLEPLAIDKRADNRLRFLTGEGLGGSHTHLNAVAVEEGQLFALMNRYGMVYNATCDRPVIHSRCLVGAHNLVLQRDRILINDTRGKRLLIFDREGVPVRSIDLLRFPEIAAIYWRLRPRYLLHAVARKALGRRVVARPIFVRGLFPLDGRRILLGFSPATIVELDLERDELVSCFHYSQDVRVCPHGIVAVP